MFQIISTASFFSLWYWVLTVVVWTSVCHRTLGVPYDMLLRAERLPAEAARVEQLAAVHVARATALYHGLGLPLAALAGFVLAALATLGFGSRLELAQAVFVLLFPLALVGLANVRLAIVLERTGATGAELRRRLARRRFWNQVIAILAILAAALAALINDPRTALHF
jgi:hypothetical protein